MKSAYRVLASLIALGVVVQAASIAYYTAGVNEDIDAGRSFGEDYFETGANAGGMIHGMDGMMIIPLLALSLLIVSFFAKIDQGVKWAGFIFLAVVVQVALGLFSHEITGLAPLHGINALILFGLAVTTALKARNATRVTDTRVGETAGAHAV